MMASGEQLGLCFALDVMKWSSDNVQRTMESGFRGEERESCWVEAVFGISRICEYCMELVLCISPFLGVSFLLVVASNVVSRLSGTPCQPRQYIAPF
jgi:hypothetical protein